MSNNPLFRANNSPTRTTKPTKSVNETHTNVRLTHNTFDNSFFNFKTQRFGQYEPFFWKNCVAGDNEPFSNSHNVRSLPFASPVLSPMKLNKDYFQVPHYAIQPNTWDYIFKSPSQGEDVPSDCQNLFPLWTSINNFPLGFTAVPVFALGNLANGFLEDNSDLTSLGVFQLFISEVFFSSGSLLYQMGFKMNPIFHMFDEDMTFDQLFDFIISRADLSMTVNLPNSDSPTGSTPVSFANYELADHVVVDDFTFCSLVRSFSGYIVDFNSKVFDPGFDPEVSIDGMISSLPVLADQDKPTSYLDSINCVRMDVINAYQLSCAQYYVNPRVDFLYNAQLYRDNWISLLRRYMELSLGSLQIDSFSYNGIPVLYDYFSQHYYARFVNTFMYDVLTVVSLGESSFLGYTILQYLFGFREQLRFGDYFTDARTQALGYGEPGSDVVTVMNGGVTVTDISQKLVLNRFRTAVAHLDNSAEDYLATMFDEQLPPDYHYPKFIVHSEFGVNGVEISNTTSDDQGNIVTNLKSGEDSAEFNIQISVPSILIGISYVSVPRVYSQIKERHYFHADRYDMFQPMLQYFGDQEIYNREKSDSLENPGDSYAYVSRNGEYKQRLSQVSGGFVCSGLRSWVFVSDPVVGEGKEIIPIYQQNPLAIRAHDFEFNRFLKAIPGVSLGSGFHFIMQYNNKNVDNRPMEVNPLPLYPNNQF